jgi:nucleotide-binding universal stress UspA family protein
VKILLAIDDSKFSEAAVDAVIRQTTPQGTEVRVLHVIEPFPIFLDSRAWGYGPETSEVLDKQRKEAEELVARAGQTLGEKHFKVMTAVEEGNPKVVILDYAAKWLADLIFVGSHGRTDLGHFLIGSVSEAVARHAQCSVQIVRVPNP